MALENIRKHIILDISKNRYVVVVVKQYDKDIREIIVKVTDDGKPYPINNTIIPRFKCQKTDGKKIYNDCTILENGDVKIDITEQLTIVAGMHDCELVLYDANSNAVLHTMSFIVNVKDSVFPDDEVVSSDEFNALQEALLKVDTFDSETITEALNTKVDSVKIGTTEYKSGTIVTLPVYTINEANSTFGTEIGLSIDTSTYKMILELKDNNGATLSNKEIDFPIESMVINASYSNGTLTLALQNGTTLDVDISSIISGLVPDTRTIADLDLKDNITATELRTALNVASGAEVNQNAFSNVVVDSTTIAADSKTDTLTLVAGDNITLTPDATNDKITISSTASGGNNVSVAQSLTSGTKVGTITVDGTATDLYAPTNTDTKATQTNTTTNSYYRLALSTNANDTTETNTLRKSTNFRANPSTGSFYAKGYDRLDITGQTLDVNTLTLEAGSPDIMLYKCKTSGGSNNISNIPLTGNPFILDVELIRWASTTDYITKQTFISIGDKHKEYVRYCTNGTWETAWTKRLFTDTTYSAATTSANGLMSKEDKTKLGVTNIAYATCNTDAATVAKVITIDGNANWTLQKGSIIVVKYTNTNSASGCTLNVNNTGAKKVWYNNAEYTGNSNQVFGYANRHMTYIYDGTYWVWIGHGIDNNSTYTNAALGQGYGTCSTAADTVAKVVTLSSYTLITGGIVSVKFTYAVPASATMNINSKGAKNIFYRGSAIVAGIINAGDIATFIYDGTQYHLISIDKGILNNTSKGALGYNSSTAQNLIPTVSTIAFWDGAYSGTSSNLAYCNKGAFGAAATKAVDTTVTSGSANLITSGGVYSSIAQKLNISDIVDNVTSTSTTLPLSAKQGKVLNDRINKLQPHPYSLAISTSTGIGALTTTQTTYTTVNNRKFSDYGTILITIGASNDDVRASLEIPRAIFTGSDGVARTFYLDCWSNNGSTFNQCAIKYVSDTSFIAYTVTSGTVCKYMNVYGIKVDDTL